MKQRDHPRLQAATPGTTLHEPRLLGTWRSDKARTLAHWRHEKELSAAAREHFASLFGKLTLHYSASHITSIFEDCQDSHPYRVLAQDATSVVIQSYHPLLQRDTLQQIFFEADACYMLSGYNVEFFMRIPASDAS